MGNKLNDNNLFSLFLHTWKIYEIIFFPFLQEEENMLL